MTSIGKCACTAPAMSPASIRSRWFARIRAIWPRISSRTIFRRLNLIVRTFPWLFTPAKANADGKLRPWLCLVVVRKQEGVTLRADRNLPLPVLEIKPPARPEHELPDLSESWAWAHAQVAGSRRDAGSLKQSLAGDPALTVSRLLCPRRLDPLTEYLACVVPAFELGRKAGLGLPIQPDDENELKPAWTAAQQSPVTLPVYFHWEFRTGTGGDFEALVGLLEARDSRDLPAEVGKRQMDISQPGFSITPPLPPGTVLELEGALRRLDAPTAEWPEETRTPFQAELKKILDAPSQAMNEEGKDPLLAPPIYGCWQAARHTVEMTPAPPASVTWLDELNLDPRHRAVAALGTQVVQTQQEQLMASAWEQLGEIERINQMRRQAQLGRAVNAVYHARHFSRFSEETLLKVVASAQSRVVVESADANTRRDAVVAKDFAIGHPGQGRLRAVAPVDEPARRNQHPLPDGRRAAHRHRGQVEHDIHCPASEEGSRFGDDQPGFG